MTNVALVIREVFPFYHYLLIHYHRSPVLWEIEKCRRQWKPVEIEVSDKLEELHTKKVKNEVLKLSNDVSIEFLNENEV